MQTIYLVLAILGASGPYIFFAQHFESTGMRATPAGTDQ